MEDDLCPEYNLKELRVRKVGSKRKIDRAKTVQLEPDVAEIFPDDNSVNEALRFLIRMTRENQESISKTILNKNTSQ
jgi:ASC-1-like (ASCH) protein